MLRETRPEFCTAVIPVYSCTVNGIRGLENRKSINRFISVDNGVWDLLSSRV